MALVVLVVLALAFSRPVLTAIGQNLVFDDRPGKADAVVVLNTGVEYYPRLIEAATLYKNGVVARIVINGNRKTDELRALEKMGFRRSSPWYEDFLRILELYGVPRDKVTAVSVEDAYDTVSEAQFLGPKLQDMGIHDVIVATSKSHTRRAYAIWQHLYGTKFKIWSAAAQADPFRSDGWWHDGRQVRWVLAEYGAWLYLWWKEYREQ